MGGRIMGIKIKNCNIENAGTGIKAEGKVNINIEGLTLINNYKDFDLSITDDSLIKIEGLTLSEWLELNKSK
jgi:hypothetical protein